MNEKLAKIKNNITILKLIIFFAVFFISLKYTGFSFNVLAKKGYRFFEFAGRMFPADIGYIKEIIMPMLMTVRMSVAGTFIGAFVGLFTSFLMAGNINKNKISCWIIKIIVQIIRTVPVLIIALMATFIFGIGAFSGTVALIIYSWAIMTRIGSDDIETMSLKTYEAVAYAGNGYFRSFFRTVFIEMIPGYLNNTLYLLETNVRHASILGYVGAGGIGLILNEKISWREYEKTGAILLLLYCAVILIELFSKVIRNNLLDQDKKNNNIKKYLSIIFLVMLIVYSMGALNKPGISSSGFKVAVAMINGIFHPDIEYLLMPGKDGVFYLLFETICIAFAGTMIGAVFALVLSILNSSKIVPVYIAYPVRLFIMAIRTVPVFIYGLMFIRVTGPGSFAGVLTLSLCSIGLISKRFTVAIDELDLGAWNAYKAMGIGWIARVKYCMLPQLSSKFISAVFYRFDVNIRSASVLGLVGAGGIGAPLIMYMNQYRWDAAGSILIGLFIVVTIIYYGVSVTIKSMEKG